MAISSIVLPRIGNTQKSIDWDKATQVAKEIARIANPLIYWGGMAYGAVTATTPGFFVVRGLVFGISASFCLHSFLLGLMCLPAGKKAVLSGFISMAGTSAAALYGVSIGATALTAAFKSASYALTVFVPSYFYCLDQVSRGELHRMLGRKIAAYGEKLASF